MNEDDLKKWGEITVATRNALVSAGMEPFEALQLIVLTYAVMGKKPEPQIDMKLIDRMLKSLEDEDSKE